ncbi:MAG: putative transposase for insertion sequence element [Rhodospirillaceae bacterium]|nr:MAG: putative transposase for insertion sequence element [Rhodospirillaceae bacterium]
MAGVRRLAMVISTHQRDQNAMISAEQIGPPLVFACLWRETGCWAVLDRLLGGRRFEFAVERAVFLTVLHRLVARRAATRARATDKW